MKNKLNELQKLITILHNEEGLSEYGTELLEGFSVGFEHLVNNLNLLNVTNHVKIMKEELSKKEALYILKMINKREQKLLNDVKGTTNEFEKIYSIQSKLRQ